MKMPRDVIMKKRISRDLRHSCSRIGLSKLKTLLQQAIRRKRRYF